MIDLRPKIITGICCLQELLEQLLAEQEDQKKQKEAQLAAQQLINAAYLQQVAAAEQQKRHEEDAKQAKELLDKAFQLTPATKSWQSTKSNPVPSRRHSGHATPKDQASVQTAPVMGQRPKTALERLLQEGSLTGLPQYSQTPQSQTPRSAWATPSTSSMPGKTVTYREPVTSTAGEPLTNGVNSSPSHSVVNSLKQEDKDRLLMAIREELKALVPPSGYR